MTDYSPREQVMGALENNLTAALKPKYITTLSRKLKLWGETNQGDRPCLFIHQQPDDITGGDKGIPSITTMHADLFVYTWAKDVAVPGALLNPIIDQVFLTLKPNLQTGKCNLGIAFVDNCWVSGKVFIDPGDLDGDGMAIIPVSIRFATPLAFS